MKRKLTLLIILGIIILASGNYWCYVENDRILKPYTNFGLLMSMTVIIISIIDKKK